MLFNPRGLRCMSSIMTVKAWTEKINSSDDIPKVFKDFFYQRDEKFPYTIYVPAISTDMLNQKVDGLKQFIYAKGGKNHVE